MQVEPQSTSDIFENLNQVARKFLHNLEDAGFKDSEILEVTPHVGLLIEDTKTKIEKIWEQSQNRKPHEDEAAMWLVVYSYQMQYVIEHMGRVVNEPIQSASVENLEAWCAAYVERFKKAWAEYWQLVEALAPVCESGITDSHPQVIAKRAYMAKQAGLYWQCMRRLGQA